MRTLLLLLLLALSLVLLARPSEAAIDCYYCGVEKLCPLPFQPNKGEVVTKKCEKACMKFDGTTATDGKRVLVRDCTTKEINECVDKEHNGAVGTYCSCNAGSCNGAPGKLSLASSTTIFLALFMLFVMRRQ